MHTRVLGVCQGHTLGRGKQGSVRTSGLAAAEEKLAAIMNDTSTVVILVGGVVAILIPYPPHPQNHDPGRRVHHHPSHCMLDKLLLQYLYMSPRPYARKLSHP